MSVKRNAKEEFISKVIAILDDICKRNGFNIQVDADTLIFEKKILDSLGFVEFIAVLEADLNVNVPDDKMSIQYFLSPASIALNFGP